MYMNTFVFIVATVGRVSPIEKLFESLLRQADVSNMRVIVVDQNGDTRLQEIIEHYSAKLDICWIGSRIGLSRARNVGLGLIDDEPAIIGFPDDDCEYPERLLSTVGARFDDLKLDFFSVTESDEDGVTDVRAPKQNVWINRYNVWQTCGSNRTFYSTRAIKAVGLFNESLGLGARTPWEGGEDIDYPIRGLSRELKGFYDQSLRVFHRSTISKDQSAELTRIVAYNAAMGRIWRSHRYPVWWFLYQCARAAGGGVVGIARLDLGKARMHGMALLGRVKGWVGAEQ